MRQICHLLNMLYGEFSLIKKFLIGSDNLAGLWDISLQSIILKKSLVENNFIVCCCRNIQAYQTFISIFYDSFYSRRCFCLGTSPFLPINADVHFSQLVTTVERPTMDFDMDILCAHFFLTHFLSHCLGTIQTSAMYGPIGNERSVDWASSLYNH